MKRREFLRYASAAGVVSGLSPWPVRGEDVSERYARLVPRDKRLAPAWVQSLTQRGHRLDAAICHGKQDVDLEGVGMTVGGIGCGTVYLSGDGQLWVWDIFNQHHEGVVPNDRARAPAGLQTIQGRQPRERDGANFLAPPRARDHKNGVTQGMTLFVGDQAFPLDADGWEDVRFTGRWPLGRIEYRSRGCPCEVTLEGFSPFVPLHLEDSNLPVTILDYEVRNSSDRDQDIALHGTLGNALGQFSGLESYRQSNVVEGPGLTVLHHTLREPPVRETGEDRLLFDFEQDGYPGWEVSGAAFGNGPARSATTPAYQGDVGQEGKGFANSHSTAPGVDVGEKDAQTGELLSPPFTLDRQFLCLLIGGGNHPGQTQVELWVEGKLVGALTGHNHNRMRKDRFEVGDHRGKQARLRVIDHGKLGWGNIGLDQVLLTDRDSRIEDLAVNLDAGSMALAYCGDEAVAATDDPPGLTVCATLAPGHTRRFRFLISWHLPNLHPAHGQGDRRRHYVTRFADALAVAQFVSRHQDRLCGDTHRWVETWNDSTLPQWLLDRTILTANTLQTQNCLLFDDGRFWAWEGIGCCPGTCGHVWQYAQGHARLFPELERNLREKTDFADAQKSNGAIRFRGANNNFEAMDAQAGYVLRTLRDLQLATDPDFLKRVWPSAKRALQFLIAFDGADTRGGLDGLLDGRQHNTLDAEWYGKVPVLCSMYLAALRAGEVLARRANDPVFAEECRSLLALGRKNIGRLFNGEYFEQDEDPAHPTAIGVGTGSYIDQVMGQFWANQVGLGRLFDAAQQKATLRALWTYNFVPDYGRFRQAFRSGRHYATEGDAGLLMCTWPRGGLRDDFTKHWQYAYFNECMTGFEYEAAAHMIAERDPDLVQYGLSITRAIHDRYSTLRGRNPYNEIECSDHYARAGASYAVFLAVCGFFFDQSLGLLVFDPVIQQDNFRVPFTTSEAWGTYAQQKNQATLRITHGRLVLSEVRLGLFRDQTPAIAVNGREVPDTNLVLSAGDTLTLTSQAR